MRPEWEEGLRGRLYALGRRLVPLPWRRALRRKFAPERLIGIRKPAVEIPRSEPRVASALPGRPDLLVLPIIAWSYRRQRPQQLAEALARRGRRVFYGAIRGPGEPSAPSRAAPGVTLLPIGGVAKEDPADRRLEGPRLEAAFESLARARDDFEMHEAVLLVQTPFWAPLATRLAAAFGWKVVYDCLDAHTGFAANRPGPLADAEDGLLVRADLVVATSEVLRERLARRRPDARLLPNACDAELFASVPPRGEPTGAMTVGYVGAVDDWFDFDLFETLARSRPDWSFELVGGAEGRRRALSGGLANVTFHGERPHWELPALRARFDVEIIPFRLSVLTHAVDPVKLYEAAAAGRPVVATPLSSLAGFARRGIVRLAATAADFASQIEAAAAEGGDAAVGRREFARANTWERRAADLDAWIGELGPFPALDSPRQRPGRPAARALARRGAEAGAILHFPPSIGWNVVLIQRPHHLARALARRGIPVLFELDDEHPDFRPGLAEVEPGVFLTGGADDALRLPHRILWSFAYNVPSAESLSRARLVYDVIDHLDVFPHPRRRLRRDHERALSAAEVVFAVSAPLLEDVRRRRPDARYLPNGVDAERFAGPPDPAAVPERLARSRRAGRPVAGYVGALARWLDTELLVSAARRRPDWDFVLIGEDLNGRLPSLERKAPANLHFLGAWPHESIPSLLASFDVGLIPFRLGPEAWNASPIKLYEYLAAGLPVVSTALPECLSIPEVRIAADAGELADLLDEARAAGTSEEHRRGARARAAENDWSRRADAVLEALALSGGRAVPAAGSP